MSQRISNCFLNAQKAGRKVLIPFITAGDPHPDWNVAVMHALVDAGADLIERLQLANHRQNGNPQLCLHLFWRPEAIVEEIEDIDHGKPKGNSQK